MYELLELYGMACCHIMPLVYDCSSGLGDSAAGSITSDTLGDIVSQYRIHSDVGMQWDHQPKDNIRRSDQPGSLQRRSSLKREPWPPCLPF